MKAKDGQVFVIELTLRYDDQDAGEVRRWRHEVTIHAATLAEATALARERTMLGTSLPWQAAPRRKAQEGA